MPCAWQSNVIAAYSVLGPSKCHSNELDISPLNLYEISDRLYGIDWFANDIQCVLCVLTFFVFFIQIPMGFALFIPIWSLSSLVWFGGLFLDVLIHFGVSDVGSHLHSHQLRLHADQGSKADATTHWLMTVRTIVPICDEKTRRVTRKQ